MQHCRNRWGVATPLNFVKTGWQMGVLKKEKFRFGLRSLNFLYFWVMGAVKLIKGKSKNG
jgi:hypothetical protein